MRQKSHRTKETIGQKNCKQKITRQKAIRQKYCQSMRQKCL